VLYQLSYDPIQKRTLIVEEGLLVKTKMSSFDKKSAFHHASKQLSYRSAHVLICFQLSEILVNMKFCR